MFVDSVKINIGSGSGGAGAVSFRREKFVIQGGPDGGDGGRGGDIYFIADKNTSTLASFRGNKNYFASNGACGEGKNKSGKKGADLHVKVPPGTQIIDCESGQILCDLTRDGQSVKLLQGGKGGMGNARFKNAINQRPTHAQKGIPGVKKQVCLELKLIADIALVGFPNAGKSSLISTITNSRPKVANYEFSTIIPNLGVVDISLLESFVIADIPGLIRGASSGRGLGMQFLRHIERTKILLFMLDITRFEGDLDSNLEASLKTQFDILMDEIKKYSCALALKPFAIAITKVDLDSKNLESFGGFALKDTLKNADTPIFISPKLKDFMDYGKKILLDSKNVMESSSQDLVDSNNSMESNSQDLVDSKNTDSNNIAEFDLQDLQDSKNITESSLQHLTDSSSQDSKKTIESNTTESNIKDSKTSLDSKNIIESNRFAEPLFIIPISSISHTNLNALKSLLNESLKAIDSKN